MVSVRTSWVSTLVGVLVGLSMPPVVSVTESEKGLERPAKFGHMDLRRMVLNRGRRLASEPSVCPSSLEIRQLLGIGGQKTQDEEEKHGLGVQWRLGVGGRETRLEEATAPPRLETRLEERRRGLGAQQRLNQTVTSIIYVKSNQDFKMCPAPRNLRGPGSQGSDAKKKAAQLLYYPGGAAGLLHPLDGAALSTTPPRRNGLVYCTTQEERLGTRGLETRLEERRRGLGVQRCLGTRIGI
jgi:hypothetical protein